MDEIKLTSKEKKILNILAEAWNDFISLENTSDDIQEFKDSIHSCQKLIALKVARRVDPDFWRK